MNQFSTHSESPKQEIGYNHLQLQSDMVEPMYDQQQDERLAMRLNYTLSQETQGAKGKGLNFQNKSNAIVDEAILLLNMSL